MVKRNQNQGPISSNALVVLGNSQVGCFLVTMAEARGRKVVTVDCPAGTTAVVRKRSKGPQIRISVPEEAAD